MKQYIKNYIHRIFWNWDLMSSLAIRSAYYSREDNIRNLCNRVSIKEMKEMLDEAEKSGEKYTTLARLLENNFKKND